MSMQRGFLLFAAVVIATSTPVMAQTPPSVAGGAVSPTVGVTSIPNFTGVWQQPAFPWFEPPPSGPGPVTNLSRWPEQRTGATNRPVVWFPSKEGIANYNQMVGDYKNPILQPWAAEVVRRHG